MRIYRFHSGSDGESHLDEVELPMASTDFAPPAPPLELSEFWEAERVSILRAASGWYGDWHPAPKRQLMVHLAGQVEGETSDGTTRVFGPGSIVLLEDTTGKGHRSRVIGSENAILCVIQLEDESPANSGGPQ